MLVITKQGSSVEEQSILEQSNHIRVRDADRDPVICAGNLPEILKFCKLFNGEKNPWLPGRKALLS